MEELKSPSPVDAATTSLYTHTLAERFQFQYVKWKSKSSLLVLIGCVAVIAVSSAALMSVPDGGLANAPFISPRVRSFFGIGHDGQQANPISQYERRIKELFDRAAMPNRTVIITTLNAAWAEEGTMIDMFIESFWHGKDTRKLLQHLIIVCVDDKAYKRCRVIHPHCFYIKTRRVNFSGEQILLTADYIKLMWRRIEFLSTVLRMNYSFIFTDTDLLWLRNPLPRLQSDTEADAQIACDHYIGKPWDAHNSPNAGFIYVRANAKTVRFYDYWYEQRKRGSHMADQEVLNAIKFDEEFTSIGMKLRFLDTQFFGGFCALTTTNMTKAITMHATCCKGLDAKLIDLRTMLEAWKKWHAQNPTLPTTDTQHQDNVEASPRNGSAGQSGPLRSHDVPKPELDRHFPMPLACPQSWHKHKH